MKMIKMHNKFIKQSLLAFCLLCLIVLAVRPHAFITLYLYGRNYYNYAHDVSVNYCKTSYCRITDNYYNDRLRKEILEQNPSLKILLNDNRLLAAKIILNWVSNHLVFAMDNPLNTTEISPGKIYYHFFKPYHAGVFCGGAADFLTKTLQLFNYTAFSLDIGLKNTTITHVITIVALPNSDQWEYYILDPTFNSTFIDRGTNDFTNLSELIKDYRNKEYFQKIKLTEDSLQNRIYLVASSNPNLKNDLKHCAGSYLDNSSSSGHYLCIMKGALLQNYCAYTGKVIAKHHLHCDETIDLQYLTHHIFSITGSEDPAAKEQLKNILQNRHSKKLSS